jgi:hypothetical protein
MLLRPSHARVTGNAVTSRPVAKLRLRPRGKHSHCLQMRCKRKRAATAIHYDTRDRASLEGEWEAVGGRAIALATPLRAFQRGTLGTGQLQGTPAMSAFIPRRTPANTSASEVLGRQNSCPSRKDGTHAYDPSLRGPHNFRRSTP